MSVFDFHEDLLRAERAAWAAIQAKTLTVAQADTVQAGITAFAAEAGLDRYAVEMTLKKTVRHPGLDA